MDTLPVSHARRFISALVAASLLLAAAWFALTTLAAIANYAWRVPMFDQFRLYAYYLTLPFPENVLQLENGHRPIVPALVRVFEVWCCAASQRLQIWLGAGLAAGSAALLCWLILRERQLSLPLRAASVLVAVAGMLWLGYARLLMHGNESVHAYLVVLAVLLACAFAARSAATGRRAPMLAASICCLIATFSFGPGVAAFGAVLLVVMLRGGRPRLLLLPALALGFALVAYLWLLPGDAGVRSQLALRPVENVTVALQWIASPWVNAWVYAAPGTGPEWVAQTIAAEGRPGQALRRSAEFAVANLGGASTAPARLAVLLGVFGLAAWVLLSWRMWRTRSSALAVEWVAIGACAFALGAAALISLARLDYFSVHPQQVFADRYLLWPGIFWMGLGLLSLMACRSAARRWITPLAIAAVAVAAVLLSPTQHIWAGWSAVVHRSAELSVIGAWTGARERVFPDGADASREQVDTTLHAMRARDLGPFATRPPVLPGDTMATAGTEECGPPRVLSSWTENGHPLAEVVGTCDGVGANDPWLVIVDVHGVVRGLARRTPHGEGALGTRLLERSAYVGLVHGHEAQMQYRVLMAQPSVMAAKPAR